MAQGSQTGISPASPSGSASSKGARYSTSPAAPAIGSFCLRRAARAFTASIFPRGPSTSRARLPGADLREGVAEQLPFDDARFDLVTCLGSLEHFLDQPRALAEMRRVARPGARVLILVPNAGFLTRRLGLSRGTWQAGVRETVRSLDEWDRMLRDAGLKPRARWRDLHVLDGRWIRSGRPITWPLRLAQALALPLWPMAWQYQVYFDCRVLADC
jgi:SAM-dependent methyltransferase